MNSMMMAMYSYCWWGLECHPDEFRGLHEVSFHLAGFREETKESSANRSLSWGISVAYLEHLGAYYVIVASGSGMGHIVGYIYIYNYTNIYIYGYIIYDLGIIFDI